MMMQQPLKLHAILNFQKNEIKLFVALFYRKRVVPLFNRAVQGHFLWSATKTFDVKKTVQAIKRLLTAGNQHCFITIKNVALILEDNVFLNYQKLQVAETINNNLCKEDVANLFYLAMNYQIKSDQKVVNIEPLNYIVDNGTPLIELPINHEVKKVQMNFLAFVIKKQLWNEINQILYETKLNLVSVLATTYTTSQLFLASHATKTSNYVLVNWQAKMVNIHAFLQKKFVRSCSLPLGFETIFHKLNEKLKTNFTVKKLLNFVNLNPSVRMQKLAIWTKNMNYHETTTNFSLQSLNKVLCHYFRQAITLIEHKINALTNNRDIKCFYWGEMLPKIAGIKDLLFQTTKLKVDHLHQPLYNKNLHNTSCTLLGGVYVMEMQNRFLNQHVYAVNYTKSRPQRTASHKKRVSNLKRVPLFEYVDYKVLQQHRQAKKKLRYYNYPVNDNKFK